MISSIGKMDYCGLVGVQQRYRVSLLGWSFWSIGIDIYAVWFKLSPNLLIHIVATNNDVFTLEYC